MNSVFTIAARDFKAFFSSPKAFAIFWFFLIFMGVFFKNFIQMYMQMQQQAPMMGGQAPTIEQLLRALFYNLHFILLLIVPAVTMSSFSEEKKSQSLRLLMTAPCSSTDIVLGKFLAALGMLGLVLLASFVYPYFTISHGNPDVAIIFTSYLGIFLLMASQISFGLWVSSLTNNQFMAFLFTMFGLFLLLILNWMAGSLGGGGIFESILKYLASSDHVDAFFKGTLSIKHTVYFICFTAMFLFFTNVTLDSQRWR
jgi:ABC-2 type transport system permease protein